MTNRITTNCDSYKLTHWKMLPPNTESVYSYFESRTGAMFNKTVFFGLQYFLKKYLVGPVVTKENISWGKELTDNHIGPGVFNESMWLYILNQYGGHLPVQIKAVPEGTPVDVSNVLLTIENTDPLCAPLTNHLETLISNIWGACTVATLSREVKILCNHYLKETSDNPDHIKFQLHDFGQRGVASPETAGIEGAGHIINFFGTDTILAMELAHDFYNASISELAFSVPASEHSIMTSQGEDGEYSVFRNLVDEFPTGILSVVIDSFDYRRFIEQYAWELKKEINSRNGKLVFRPDSGEPVSTTLDVLSLLDKVFGSTTNSKGYKVLNPKVGMLWGDGIDYNGIRNILFAMKNSGWASDNTVFGMGGGLLQKINRDTQRFAFKCSAQQRNGSWIEVFKKPLDLTKKSKCGRLKLIRYENNLFHTVKEDEPGVDCLELVFKNGQLIRDMNFSEIRKNATL